MELKNQELGPEPDLTAARVGTRPGFSTSCAQPHFPSVVAVWGTSRTSPRCGCLVFSPSLGCESLHLALWESPVGLLFMPAPWIGRGVY